MLRPERMTRAIIAGPRDDLSKSIEILHELRLIHIIDYHGEDDTFRIGAPLPPAAEMSDNLVKLRSIANILAAKAPPKEKERVDLGELRQKILNLELNLTEEDEARKKAEALVSDLKRRIDELRPFAELGLTLDSYRGYESVAVIVGRFQGDATELERTIPTAEVFVAANIVATFVPKALSEKAMSTLSRIGFTQFEIPSGDGHPKDLVEAAVADQDKWAARLKAIEQRLDTLRERYAAFVVAAEEALEVEVDKAEAPLRFAVSDHSFVADGWVPSAGFKRLRTQLEAVGVYVEAGETHHSHEDESPPVLLKNPKPAKPFELLIHLYSTPSYHELDPTVFLFIAAPFFFGFMIGDAGYGIIFIAMGIVAWLRLDRVSFWWKLCFWTAVGGFWATVFGLFVFGEAFGLPFHPAPGHMEELSWETLGLSIPLQPLIHKAFGIADLMYLSVLFAALHMGTGYLFGFVNELPHSKKLALAKLGWLACLFGLFSLLTFTLRWNGIAGWVWKVPLGWFPRSIQVELSSFVGLQIPLFSLILMLGGLAGLVETVIAPIEIASLLANVMSYARLAGIGIGKAAIAAAFNVAIIEGLILPGQIVWIIVGIVFLVLAQALVFLLGWISAGIQALRLNYVEAFLKFFQGNGTLFRPFGARETQEV